MPDQTVCPGSSGQGGRTTVPELDQPLIMVVVLVVIARTATSARAAVAVFRVNRRAANMARIVADTRETPEIVTLGRRVLARLGCVLSRLVRCFAGVQ